MFYQIAKEFLLMAKMPRVNQYILCEYFPNHAFAQLKEKKKNHFTVSHVSHLALYTHIK